MRTRPRLRGGGRSAPRDGDRPGSPLPSVGALSHSRALCHLHPPPRIHVNFPLGNVADRESPHFDDTLDDWVEGRSFAFPYTTDEVEAAKESETVLPAAGQ